jgi:hypothetical protein
LIELRRLEGYDVGMMLELVLALFRRAHAVAITEEQRSALKTQAGLWAQQGWLDATVSGRIEFARVMTELGFPVPARDALRAGRDKQTAQAERGGSFDPLWLIWSEQLETTPVASPGAIPEGLDMSWDRPAPNFARPYNAAGTSAARYLAVEWVCKPLGEGGRTIPAVSWILDWIDKLTVPASVDEEKDFQSWLREGDEMPSDVRIADSAVSTLFRLVWLGGRGAVSTQAVVSAIFEAASTSPLTAGELAFLARKLGRQQPEPWVLGALWMSAYGADTNASWRAWFSEWASQASAPWVAYVGEINQGSAFEGPGVRKFPVSTHATLERPAAR